MSSNGRANSTLRLKCGVPTIARSVLRNYGGTMPTFRFALFASVAELVLRSAALAQPAPVPAPQQQPVPASTPTPDAPPNPSAPPDQGPPADPSPPVNSPPPPVQSPPPDQTIPEMVGPLAPHVDDKPAPRKQVGFQRNFAGSVQLDYMAIPTEKTGRDVALDGATTEVSLKLAMDFNSHVSASVKVCYACHGFETGMAYFDLRAIDELDVRVGRFTPRSVSSHCVTIPRTTARATSRSSTTWAAWCGYRVERGHPAGAVGRQRSRDQRHSLFR